MNEELKVLITAEIDKLKTEVGNAKKEIGKLDKDTKKSGGNIKKSLAAIGKAAKAGFKVMTTAVAAGAAALVGLSESTAEYRTAQAKLNAAFVAAGSTVEQAKETYNGLYRVLGDSDVAVEAANHLGKLT